MQTVTLAESAGSGELYGAGFFAGIRGSARPSAAAIVPLLCGAFRPSSVIDVGCGTGTWLSVFRDAGVKDLMGIDGPWVDAKAFEIGAENFRAVDLSHAYCPPRRFDLVTSLEVAEHLPASAASDFVQTLTSCGELILFSAACPGQGGTNHLNEQWSDYWVRLFDQRGYHPIDWLRPQVWQMPTVAWWYAQNALLFVQSGTAIATQLAAGFNRTGYEHLSLVHPRHYETVRHELAVASREADLRQVPVARLLRAAAANVVRRWRKR